MDTALQPARQLGMSPIWDMFKTVLFAKTVQVALSYNIPDLLKNNPRSVAELARVTGTHENTLYRLLRTLSTIGVVERIEENRFAETPLSRSLCIDEPETARHLVLWLLGSHWSTIGALEHSVRTGQAAFNHVHGMSLWQWNALHPDENMLFNKAMSSFTVFEDAVVQAYDFSSIRLLADIGGGYGGFLRKVLKANPSLRGILFDTLPVIAEAKEYFTADELEARTQLVAGDFLAGVPEGADAYLFKHVLHNWDDQSCILMLSHCRAVTDVGSKVLILEQIFASENTSDDSVCGDMLMLLALDGARERSVAEYQALLEASGFEMSKVIPVNDLYSIVEGVAI